MIVESFEEKFPSLKVHTVKRFMELTHPLASCCNVIDIEKHCLNKQKVRDTIINRCNERELASNGWSKIIKEELLKQLNLEE